MMPIWEWGSECARLEAGFLNLPASYRAYRAYHKRANTLGVDGFALRD